MKPVEYCYTYKELLHLYSKLAFCEVADLEDWWDNVMESYDEEIITYKEYKHCEQLYDEWKEIAPFFDTY